NLRIVQFAARQLVPPRVSGGMKMGDVIDMFGQTIDHMSLADLLMIDVKHDFDVLAAHRSDNIECFITAHEVVSGVIDEFIERFDDERNIRGLEQRDGLDQTVDERLMLVFTRNARQKITDLRNQRSTAELLGSCDGFL